MVPKLTLQTGWPTFRTSCVLSSLTFKTQMIYSNKDAASDGTFWLCNLRGKRAGFINSQSVIIGSNSLLRERKSFIIVIFVILVSRIKSLGMN